ncbi:hypothetical protein NW762_011517 [Fusarium torreyae]|uniref:1-alkyl-2-acetylglycerophosphocholine esterase n=1 Tax=Fusarium torreyae TaxID=1237075 RepID=A0A9W8V9V6_9HYPO|nr:hypothetical protein NW762_011517 [Fusarium torreyae]
MRFLNFLVGFAAATSAILVPSVSPGPYSVGLRIKALTDESRWDPYAPKDDPQKRRVLLSAFTPVGLASNSCPHEVIDIPYMPPNTAKVFGAQTDAIGLPHGVFEDLQMRLCRLPDDKVYERSREEAPAFPVVIFSPGRGVSRLAYNAIGRTLASHGYDVLTVDHAYDAAIIEFPDGSSVTGVTGEANQTVLEKSAEVRQKDISFIIDQLKDEAIAKSLIGFTLVDRIFVFGHSAGAAAAACSLFADDRILGAINFDGDMLGPVAESGLDKPFFIIGKPHSREQGPSWNRTWENLRGPAMMMQIEGTTHQSFFDAPLLVTLRDVPEGSEGKIDAAIGTIDGRRMSVVLTELTVAILEFVFEGAVNRLCQALSSSSEVTILETKGIDCA